MLYLSIMNLKEIEMVVYGSKTREAALQMVRQTGKVFYSDANLYSAIVSLPEELDHLIQLAFDRDDIAIVAREKHLMEFYTSEKKRVARLKYMQEKKAIREWAKKHPKEVAKVLARN